MGMGLILSGLSGAGNAAADIGRENLRAQEAREVEALKQEDERRMLALRADSQVEMQKRIADYQANKVADPLKRISKYIQAASAEEVTAPIASAVVDGGEAPPEAPATALDGGWDAINAQTVAAQPERDATRLAILKTELEKETDPKNRAALERDIARTAATAGNSPVGAKMPIVSESAKGEAVTRKRTVEEAVLAGLEYAKVHDPEAYIAGRTLVEDKYMSVGEGGSVFDKTKGGVVFQNTAKTDRLKAEQEAKDARQDKQIEAQFRMAQMKADSVANAKSFKPEDVDRVAALIAANKMAPLSNYAMSKPQGAAIMARVQELNPNYDAKDFKTMARSEGAFAVGPEAKGVRSFNVAISHLGTLESLIGALENKDTQAINKFGNFIAAQTGATAPVEFNAAKKIVSDEIVKSIIGSGGGVSDREEAAKTIDAANSPAQLRGVIKNYNELMKGQLEGLRDQYARTTGKDDFDEKFLTQAARDVAHAAYVPSSPSASPAAAASPAKAAAPAGKTILRTGTLNGRKVIQYSDGSVEYGN